MNLNPPLQSVGGWGESKKVNRGGVWVDHRGDLITWSLVTFLLPSPAKGSTDQTLVGKSLSQLTDKRQQLLS